jgi:hypothetical protein
MNEIESHLQAEIQNFYSRSLTVYAAQAIFIVVLAIVGWFVVPTVPNSVELGLFTPIWVLILFIAVGALVARRVLTRWERLRDIKLLRGTKGLLRALQTNTIILSALAELVMIAGFASAYFRGDRGDLVRALFIAAIVMLASFPKKKVWKTVVSSLEGV